MKYTKVYIGVTKGDGVLSRAIAKLTSNHFLLSLSNTSTIPSHVLLGFENKGEENKGVYFEALLDDKGFKGPKPFEYLQGYLKEHKKAWAKKYYLEVDEETVMQIYRDCEVYKKSWVYADTQLLQQFLLIRFGIPFKESKNHVTCSEAVSRILKPYGFDFLKETGLQRHDYVSPYDVQKVCIKWGLECKTV